MMEVCSSSWRKRGLFGVKYDGLYHCVFAQHLGNLCVHIVIKYDVYCSSVFDRTSLLDVYKETFFLNGHRGGEDPHLNILLKKLPRPRVTA